MPATLIVPYHNNSPTRAFNIIPAAVSQPTPVDITATYGGVTITQTLTVVPAALAQLYLTPTTIIGGCGTSAGKIALTGAAPSGRRGGHLDQHQLEGDRARVGDGPRRCAVPDVHGDHGHGDRQPDRIGDSELRRRVAGADGHGPADTSGHAGAVAQSGHGGRQRIGIGRARVCRAPGWNRGHPVEQQRAGGRADRVEHHHSGGGDDGIVHVRTSPVTANTNVNIYATVYGVRKTAALTVRP